MSSPKCHVSVEVFLPVRGDAAGRSRCRLPARVMRGLRQSRAFVKLLSPVVPEPVLPRLEALDDRVPGLPRMVRGVLGGRGVTTTDMSALRAAAQVQPPAIARQAFRTAGAVRWYRRFDSMHSHVRTPSTRGATLGFLQTWSATAQHRSQTGHHSNTLRIGVQGNVPDPGGSDNLQGRDLVEGHEASVRQDPPRRPSRPTLIS